MNKLLMVSLTLLLSWTVVLSAKDIDSEAEPPTADLVFSIVKTSETERSHQFEVRGTYRGKPVGFAIRMPKSDPNRLWLIPQEPYTKNFIVALAKAYSVPVPVNSLRNEIELVSILLKGNPRDLLHSKLLFKCFYDTEERKNLYSEFYINIHLGQKRLELAEKDFDYRPNIVKLLSQ
ncbi:hypothetical protein QMM42_16140 [Leptospira santarosai]|uniref:hypothetical protein n=1 Tax=Leptospira santarosai TaxID=28183 RepID=UPI000248A589|nr:hypothetical protein [Leptospira santarosai]MDI7157980.1 hypothetical protein [Leptospira santarosai]MDI7184365.1 hypothetical protein [Leptospira santarosai]MDI7187712.1 hypothetical protein [Leptospira santarosai]MDI7208410.1 hypothetical protein [Leptospira santarosai]MDI7222878.1 hypothetical protein [Leptospira santarosai]